MGITQRLGTIPLAISTDTSNNVGIGGSPSGSYKLEVTGTAKFSSTITMGNTITIGNQGGVDTTVITGGTGYGAKIQLNGASGIGALITGNTDSYVNATTGNFGVGQTSPTYKLDVSGTGRFTSAALNAVQITNTGVAHGMTGWAPTNTVASLGSYDSSGNFAIMGFSSSASQSGLSIFGFIGVTNPTTTVPAILLNAGKKSGTAQQALASTETTFQFTNAGTAQMTILGSGNVGIGTSSPLGSAAERTLHLSDGGGGYATVYVTNSSNSVRSIFGMQSSANLGIIGTQTNTPFAIYTNDTERMRILSTGQLCVATTAVVNPGGVAGISNMANPNNNGAWALALQNNATTGSYGRGIGIRNQTDFNSTDSEFIFCVGNTTPRFFVQSNGGIYNYQTNNVNLSDIRTKKDIVPLESYWDKFKAIEIVKFKYKDQTHDDYNIGVIAQQVLEIAPEFVNEDGFGGEQYIPEDGIPLKSIYTEDLHTATIKVLQEAMIKIEELQSRLDKAGL